MTVRHAIVLSLFLVFSSFYVTAYVTAFSPGTGIPSVAIGSTDDIARPDIRFPDTAAGKAAAAYFEAFNAGEGAMRKFFEAFSSQDSLREIPIKIRLDRYRKMRGQLGSLEPLEILASGPNALSVTAEDPGGRLLQLDFEFETVEPHGLLGIRIEALAAREGMAPPPDPKADDDELAAAVRNHLRSLTEAGEFSGVVLIARNGEPFFEEAFGWADREKKIPNRTDTRFNVGSINKSFTSLAVRMLAAENKLSLDDTIDAFLPDYPNRDAAAKVTVRQLIAMTSGIGDFFGESYQAADRSKILTLADYLPLFAETPLAFEPGSGNLYSNGGYIVLGLIIEKVTGIDYYTWIRDNIYAPAGMLDSGWPARDADVPNRAVGYVRDGSSWKTNLDTLPGRGSSAGGGYATARDLLNYTIALENGLFGEAGEARQGGMGIAGGAPGLNAALEWMPESGITIVVMANLSPPAAGRVARQIRAWLPR
jgi:D-alanyl-D-alanine carboxypeptidase